MDTLYRCYLASAASSGSLAVVTDPIDEVAEVFYARYGFIRLEGSKRMFIMMKTIESVFETV